MDGPGFSLPLKLDTGDSQSSEATGATFWKLSRMDGNRVSDFSIERILSPQVGPKPQVMEVSPDVYLQGHSGGFGLDFGYSRPPAPVPAPVAVPGCSHYRGMSFGEARYPCGAGYHRADFYPNSGACVSADAQLCPCYHGYHQPGASPQSQHRQKPRMRTVFTDTQTKQLEALFELTDYPPVEARAELARRTGLSEEIVRVWFKNRRARRKRQHNGPGVQSPSSPLSAGAEKLP